MRILVVGSSNIDTTLYVKSLPKDGETISALSRNVALGGKGLNQAIAIKRAGGEITFLTSLGEDPDANLVIEQLNKEEIPSYISFKKEVKTGSAFINVSEKGENSIVIDGGSNNLLNKFDIDKYKDQFDNFDYLLLQNEINEETNTYLIDIFHSLNKKVVLNNSPFRHIGKELLNKIDYLFINEVELFSMYQDITNDSSFKEISEYLSALFNVGVNNIILTLSKDGALFANKDTKIKVEAKKVISIDTVGAGDTFTGYFLSEISKNKDIKTALLTATKAAAISVTRKGAIPSIPTIKEVEEFKD